MTSLLVRKQPISIFHPHLPYRNFAKKGSTFADFKKSQGKFGKDRDDQDRASYEADKKKRYEQKMNWGIKNRWEQRQLDDVMKNKDVRRSQFRDLAKIKQDSYGQNVTEFNSVDEIYFFLDQIFTEGFDEKTSNMALDVFLRDYAQFEAKDLENETFKKFVRDLGLNLITFSDEKSFVKTARFMDWFVVDDADLWVNLEIYIFKKENIFSPESMVAIASHFASQGEGSRDFYDFLEFQYNSQLFKHLDAHDFITFCYSFYQVHAGTKSFMMSIGKDMIEKLNEQTTTYDLLRVMQTFSEISEDYVELFIQLETLFLKRLDQMTANEITTCACGYSISGFGTPYFNQVLEQEVMSNLAQFDSQSLKELARAFVFSMRGSKLLLQMLLPRFQNILSDFSINECCYLLYSYHDVGYVPKLFAQQIEDRVKGRLQQTEEITIQELALIVKVFCASRTAHRNFHKLLETTLLMRIDELKQELGMLHQIGRSFEESGLCSIDTLKVLKKHAFQQEVENEVFE